MRSMFLDVVARICMYRNFDGMILLERVGEVQVIKHVTAHKQFSDNVYTYKELKAGK